MLSLRHRSCLKVPPLRIISSMVFRLSHSLARLKERRLYNVQPVLLISIGWMKAPLGEVSGGQAQRIQIARALARSDVHLLIFDECTSALDGENQRQVLEAIMNVRRMTGEENQGLKMVVITHKTEVMQMCDRVVVVKEGKVCEEGVYEELVVKKGGVLRELARGGIWEA